ncbi:MAG TPA: hypothetical protein VHM30_13070 [Gemmatimonadaceae bacterium]|nr:hypothetical protein [Gemmatimonadaceae bacterium]
MSAPRLSILALALAGVAACYTSPPLDAFPPARKAGGIYAAMHMMDGRRFGAELLTVNDTAYVLSWDQYVGVARYTDVKQADLEGIGYLHEWAKTKPPREALYRARLMSRFPYGIPDTALKQLLAVKQQAAVANFAVFSPPRQ